MTKNAGGGRRIGAPSAHERTMRKPFTVTLAERERTAPPQLDEPAPSLPTSDTRPETPTSADSGSTPGKSGSVDEFLTSRPSEARSTASTRSWKTPPNVKAFAAQ